MNKLLNRVEDGHTYAGLTDLKVMTCPDCCVTYAIPLRLQEAAYNAGERKIVWFCPNGHELGYNGPSEADKALEKAKNQARWANERLTAERELREDTERRLRAQKGATTRAKKRAVAATCPCCGRSFSQLRRHMAAKHPEALAEHGIAPDTTTEATA
jgi:hypothetical protein